MNNLSIFDKKNRVSDKVLNFFIQASSALSVLILVVCIGYILYRGIPHFDFSYLVNTTSILNKKDNLAFKAVYPSSSNPTDFTKAVLNTICDLNFKGKILGTAGIFSVESDHIPVRVYKDVFLIFDGCERVWELVRIIVP